MSPAIAAPAFTKKGMATRARIVKIAAELIFERGVGDTSIEDVCREAGALDSIPALRAWAKSHADIQEQRHCVGGCAFGSLVGQVSKVESATYEDFRNGFSKWQQPILEGLNAIQRRGELRSDAKPAELAEGLMASLQGGLLLTQAQGTHRPLEVALATTIDYIESLTVSPPA